MALQPNRSTTVEEAPVADIVALEAVGVADASTVTVATDEDTAHEPICVPTTLSNALGDQMSNTPTRPEATE